MSKYLERLSISLVLVVTIIIEGCSFDAYMTLGIVKNMNGGKTKDKGGNFDFSTLHHNVVNATYASQTFLSH